MLEIGIIPFEQLQSVTPTGVVLCAPSNITIDGTPLEMNSSYCEGLQAIQAEMHRRNHLGYGLGRWIGKKLGWVSDEGETPASSEPQTEGEILESMRNLIIADDDPAKDSPEDELSELFSKLAVTKPCDPLITDRSKIAKTTRRVCKDNQALKPIDRACLRLDGAEGVVGSNPLHVEMDIMPNLDSVKAIMTTMESFAHFSDFSYSFMPPQRWFFDFDLFTYPTLKFRLIDIEGVWGNSPLPYFTNDHWNIGLHPEYLERFNPDAIARLVKHEASHLILGGLHADEMLDNLEKCYNTSESPAAKFVEKYDVKTRLITPDYTDMQDAYAFRVGEFVKGPYDPYKGLKYCETFNAIRKYGPNLDKGGQQVVHDLSAKTISETLTNQGGEGTLDASNLWGPAVIYMDAGACPTQTNGLVFFNAYQSDMTSVITSQYNDRVHLGSNDNLVEITGGDAKQLHIYANEAQHQVKGFRPELDTLVFHGCKIPMVANASSTNDVALPCGQAMVKLFDVKRHALSQERLSKYRMPEPFECFDKQSQVPPRIQAIIFGGVLGTLAAYLETRNCCGSKKAKP